MTEYAKLVIKMVKMLDLVAQASTTVGVDWKPDFNAAKDTADLTVAAIVWHA